jgi:hypothetical protein
MSIVSHQRAWRSCLPVTFATVSWAISTSMTATGDLLYDKNGTAARWTPSVFVTVTTAEGNPLAAVGSTGGANGVDTRLAAVANSRNAKWIQNGSVDATPIVRVQSPANDGSKCKRVSPPYVGTKRRAWTCRPMGPK